MGEVCNSKCHFSSLVIYDFLRICSFIFSHPLYFSYLVFFSPYLLKLISFLSPLFITTSLLFLAFLRSSQTHLTPILQRLQDLKKGHPNEEEEEDHLGIYEIVFGPSSMAPLRGENPSEILIQTQVKHDKKEPIIGKIESLEENNKVTAKPEPPPCAAAVVEEDKRLENFLKILDEFERLSSNVDDKKIKKPLETSRKVVEKPPPLSSPPPSNAREADSRAGKESSTMAKSQSQRITSTTASSDDREGLSSYGSMRREREWKRTLACKLFEERHNAAAGGGVGGEAMDSLWEAYEVDSNKTSSKRSRDKVVTKLEEDEDEDVGGAQLCCLQALKMSAGKMNLGVRRPNLVKISKAIKGIGWLHNLTKNSKKVHNNGDHHRL